MFLHIFVYTCYCDIRVYMDTHSAAVSSCFVFVGWFYGLESRRRVCPPVLPRSGVVVRIGVLGFSFCFGVLGYRLEGFRLMVLLPSPATPRADKPQFGALTFTGFRLRVSGLGCWGL